ncbi:hypothetical protein AVEN_217463-1 [Araneus ventricosus]|uniref:Uncharacterized protein n=1 Tax=Araneus ventricosus TaxID=182803 RepID=A0A4Y2JM27_ARAVE|nr:hypothetical protein AVEN_217463-1 [Araneus ventricosus]
MLIKKFAGENITVEQVVEDADATIINKAVEGSRQSDCVITVGKDMDLTVILTALAPDNNLLVLMRPGRKTETYLLFLKKMSKKVEDNILFLHAFSGCDSTSTIFRQGKRKFAKLLDSGIQKDAEVFKNSHAAAREVGE